MSHSKRRWVLPLLAYLVLAAASAYSVSQVQSQGAEGRQALAQSAMEVVVEGCERDNATRHQLVLILKEYEKANYTEIRRQFPDPNDPKAHEAVKGAREFYRESYGRLGPADCSAAADKITDAP